jgi:hypothetical protein
LTVPAPVETPGLEIAAGSSGCSTRTMAIPMAIPMAIRANKMLSDDQTDHRCRYRLYTTTTVRTTKHHGGLDAAATGRSSRTPSLLIDLITM